MHGLARAFTPVTHPTERGELPVRELGWRFAWDAPGQLEGASAIFINLPSGDGPGFRWSEVRAIREFVRSGGGLMLVTDHTDCYGHGDMLAQLADELGFSVPAVGALDPEHALGARAKAWFEAVPVAEHPVTEGVRRTGWMSPGSVGGLTTLVATGRHGWADRAEPDRRDDSSGFTGNLVRETEEREGEIPLVAAGTFGQGRIVVLADQNAFGATMIGFGDNARLFANALGWVTGWRLQPPAPEVVTRGAGCADAYEAGFRSLQVALARRGRDACRAAVDASRTVVLPDALANGSQEFGPNTRALLLDPALTLAAPFGWMDAEGIERNAVEPPPAAEIARLRVSAEALTNASLGAERDDPADPRFAPGNRVLDAALDWLFASD